MKLVFTIIRIAMAAIFAIAIAFGVVGLPVMFFLHTPISPLGYIGIVYLLISIIFFIYNGKNIYWIGEDYKQLETWQIILITMLSFVLLLTLMFAVL